MERKERVERKRVFPSLIIMTITGIKLRMERKEGSEAKVMGTRGEILYGMDFQVLIQQ